MKETPEVGSVGVETPEVGSVVVYHDSQGVDHPALVTRVEGKGAEALLSLAFVAADEERLDAYGRIVLRATSMRHASVRPPTGLCWRRAGMEMGPAPEPPARRSR